MQWRYNTFLKAVFFIHRIYYSPHILFYNFYLILRRDIFLICRWDFIIYLSFAVAVFKGSTKGAKRAARLYAAWPSCSFFIIIVLFAISSSPPVYILN